MVRCKFCDRPLSENQTRGWTQRKYCSGACKNEYNRLSRKMKDPFECVYCGYAAYNVTKVKSHMAAKHSIAEPTELDIIVPPGRSLYRRDRNAGIVSLIPYWGEKL